MHVTCITCDYKFWLGLKYFGYGKDRFKWNAKFPQLAFPHLAFPHRAFPHRVFPHRAFQHRDFPVMQKVTLRHAFANIPPTIYYSRLVAAGSKRTR